MGGGGWLLGGGEEAIERGAGRGAFLDRWLAEEPGGRYAGFDDREGF